MGAGVTFGRDDRSETCRTGFSEVAGGGVGATGVGVTESAGAGGSEVADAKGEEVVEFIELLVEAAFAGAGVAAALFADTGRVR